MTDKEKCLLELDWESIFKDFNMSCKMNTSMVHPQSVLFMELVEREINKAASKLIEEHGKDKTRAIR